MRKLIYSMMVSLDGFIERSLPLPAGERGGERGLTWNPLPNALDWVIIDEELHSFANEQAREAGAFLEVVKR